PPGLIVQAVGRAGHLEELLLRHAERAAGGAVVQHGLHARDEAEQVRELVALVHRPGAALAEGAVVGVGVHPGPLVALGRAQVEPVGVQPGVAGGGGARAGLEAVGRRHRAGGVEL
ncbi:MAG: hypothetical protein ACK559_17995, partial [bacterium]